MDSKHSPTALQNIASQGTIGSKGVIAPLSTVKEDDDYVESGSISPVLIRKKANINLKEKIFVKEYGQIDETTVQRFVINPSATADLIGTVIRKNELHDLETKSFKLALKELLENGKKVVLVDFFRRSSKDNSIVEDKKRLGKIPETHTICLYLNASSNNILLIDPSNYGASEFLQTTLQQRFDVKIELFTKSKFYVANESLYGREDGKPRDCIDIAVKIALHLMNKESLDSVHYSIATLSNQVEYNPHLNEGTNGILVRNLQSMNPGSKEKIVEMLVKNKKKLEVIKIVNEDELNNLNSLSIDDETLKCIKENFYDEKEKKPILFSLQQYRKHEASFEKLKISHSTYSDATKTVTEAKKAREKIISELKN